MAGTSAWLIVLAKVSNIAVNSSFLIAESLEDVEVLVFASLSTAMAEVVAP